MRALLRALGERFTFQVDMQTGAIDGVTGSLAILDKTLASLDPLQTARLRVPLFDPTVLRDVLEHLTHALPDEPHLPRTWSLLRGQLRLLRRQGAAAELSVGPTLEPPEVEVVFERNLDEPVGRLGVDGRGRASATRSGLRWTPVGVPNPEEKEFDLRSTLELASRLSHARGRLEAATLEQRWEQERTYRLPGDAARERKALSFGRESFSLRRLSD